MPRAAPAYSRHWAKNHSTLSLISPTGSTQNPATDKPTPATSIPTADQARKSLFIIRNHEFHEFYELFLRIEICGFFNSCNS